MEMEMAKRVMEIEMKSPFQGGITEQVNGR